MLGPGAVSRYAICMEMKKADMKVYMVAGSYDYEGDSVDGSGKVFFDYEEAVAYGKSLVRKKESTVGTMTLW